MPRYKNDTVTFNIEGIPPSLNHAYGITARYGRVRRFPLPKLKEWIDIVSVLPTQYIQDADTYGVEVLFYFPIHTKEGKMRRKDTDNMLKYVIDPVIDKTKTYSNKEINDCQIVEIHAYKCDANKPRTEISLFAMV